MSSASNELEWWAITDGLLIARDGAIEVIGVAGTSRSLPAGATSFGLVAAGVVAISGEGLEAVVAGPSYFVSADPRMVNAERGSCLVIAVHGYRGIAQLGARLEDRGRLRYIDGCTDTLLVCPPKAGEPCLNHLHIPPHTRQSTHVHPSVRLGIIARGRGRCITSSGERALEPGLGWRIPPHVPHAFVTDDEPLDVLAWHPDSDFGPRDEDHPMINRTIR
jgi:quercetin dioxygenase-like cupin family protein